MMPGTYTRPLAQRIGRTQSASTRYCSNRSRSAASATGPHPRRRRQRRPRLQRLLPPPPPGLGADIASASIGTGGSIEDRRDGADLNLAAAACQRRRTTCRVPAANP